MSLFGSTARFPIVRSIRWQAPREVRTVLDLRRIVVGVLKPSDVDQPEDLIDECSSGSTDFAWKGG